jgi:GntR family transcriptional regulator / MocR family aminotransferase
MSHAQGQDSGLFEFRENGKGALYEQLAQSLRRAILDGQFVVGGKLPSSRLLARSLGISRNTVLAAYEVLSAEHLVVARGRKGTRLASHSHVNQSNVLPAIAPPPSRYVARVRKLPPTSLSSLRPQPAFDLHYGEAFADPRLLHSWRRKLSAAALRASPHYPDPCGFLPLRRAICDYLVRRRGISCTEKDVLIVAGTQQAIALIARVTLNEGDVAVIEDPHYQYARQALVAHGAHVIAVRTDDEGLVTSEVAPLDARLVYVTPSHQFPSGVVMSLKRRMELLQIVTQQRGYILEDDYDSEFLYRNGSLPALRTLAPSNRVIYVGTFSKTLFPSLRLGYIVCPTSLRDDLSAAKRLDDLGCPAIEQAALAAFIQSGQFDKHLRNSVEALRPVRDVLVEGLRRHCGDQVEIRGDHSGVHIVAWFKRMRHGHLDRLVQLACERGLGLYSIAPSYQARPPTPGLILGYAGLTAGGATRAMEIFGEAFAALGKDELPLSRPSANKIVA